MMRHVFTLGALLVASLPVWAQREYGFDNRKPSGQPYLKPEESLSRMKVAPEFEVKLFAAEPNVVNPVAMTIDERGRVWVVECFEYPSRTPPGKAPRDRIVILEDTDGDGVCDKRTVFAEGKDFPVPEERRKKGLGAFDLCTGIEVGHGGVYVGAAPYLWFIENKNDKPGKFETLLGGFGSQDTHETLNTFQWGPDGWLYGLHGIFTQSDVTNSSAGDQSPVKINGGIWRFHPKLKKFEIFAEGTSNPWGMDWRGSDGQFILACCVIPHLYHIVPGGIYQRQAGASYNPYVYNYIREICDHTFHRESGWAHAGLVALDWPHIPEKYRNSVIFGSIHGCSIKQNILKPNGSSFAASRGDDFLVSGDKNFRPINMRWGPNGDIYLIDWHDQNPCHQAEAGSWDYERGRVYRIQLKGTKTSKPEDLSQRTRQQLAETSVFSNNPWEQRTALRLLSESKDEFRVLIRDPNQFLRFARMMLAPEGYLQPKHIPYWLGTMLPNATGGADSRAFIYRTLGSLEGTNAELVKKLAVETSVEPSPIGRRELASAAIKLADKHDVSDLVHALMKWKDDANDPLIPHLTWIAYEKSLSKQSEAKARDRELDWLATNAEGNRFITEQIVPKVMRRLVASGKKEDLALGLKFVASVKSVEVRKQALSGLAVALKDQVVDAPEAWKTLQPELRKETALVSLVNQLSVNFRDPEALKRAYDVVKNSQATSDARIDAIRQVVLLRHPEALTLCGTLVRNETDAKVRAEAARQLSAFDDPRVPAETLRDWKAFSDPIRVELVTVLASRKPWAKAMLNAMKAGTIDRKYATDNTIVRIQSFNDRELNSLIESAWGRTRKTPAELQTLIDKTRGELDATPASFARGKVVFDNQCAKCHQFDGRGQAVGPPLDGAGRDIEYLLTNVIDPNRVIGAPYFLRTATLLDGKIEQGVLAEEDDRSITLKVENGVLKKLLKKDLDGPVKVQEKSMMPEGLTAGMSPADFRDLVRYTMMNPFITHVTLNGKKAGGGVSGKIPLPGQAGEVTLTFTVTAPAAMDAKLMIGCADDVTVLNGDKVLGGTKGTGNKRAAPDQETVAFALPKGSTTLTVKVKHKAAGEAIYLRFADPDRKLRYEGE
ncbi:MAG: PVC-type heme-binding CxxCH protein [Gemmataceae bacterium]